MLASGARKDGDSDDPCWEDLTPEQRRAREGKLPSEERNRNVRCKGRSVIRYKKDEDGHKKDDPILDADGARQYRPCEAFGANGTDYCTAHGGSTPAVINAAKRTLALGADDFATALRAIAVDERVPAETRIKAINSALDRIGIRTGMEVSLETPGWQKLMGEMFGAESSSEDERARDDEAADPGGVIRERVRKLTTPPAVAPTPPAEETKRVPRKAVRRKATPPPAKPKHEW